ncbi:MAG: sugar phosphate isomerase/epimerase [Betaproteobacteria bacterium]|nr:MAG: sugar phosphate isomerase/epimerase [Betaproteobacteria bacterium]
MGLAALTVLELPHHEQVSAAAQAGYSHVGLRLIPVAGQPVIHALDAAEVERRLADTGVGVLDVEVFRLMPQTNVGEFEAVMATAQRLGATELLVHGADSSEARLIETFGRLCDLAAGYGLSANLEPMPWVDVSNLAKAMRVLDGAARVHFFRAGDSPQALAKVPRRFLRYMQLCDARPERPADMQEIIRQARSDRLFPGQGGLDLKGLLRALPGEIPISLEIPISKRMEPLERARRALDATRAILTMGEHA